MGMIAGMVSISAACGSVEVGSACGIAVLGSFFYIVTSVVLRLAGVDDVMDTFAVYGACGMWGVIAAPFFDWGKGFDFAHGNNGFHCIPTIGLNPDGTSPMGGCMHGAAHKQLRANFALLGAVFIWVAVMSAIVLVILKVTGLLSESKDIESSAYVWPIDDGGEQKNSSQNVDII